MILTDNKDLKIFLKDYWPCFIVILAFFGFISKALYNYPVGVMALIGIYIVATNPKILIFDRIIKNFTLIFY